MTKQINTVMGSAFAAAMLAATAASSAADFTAPFGDQSKLEALSGIYESVAPENWYGAYGTRAFKFENGAWSLDFVFALDPMMQKKVFAFHTEGPYKIVGKSTSVDGAYEARFTEAKKAVALFVDDAKLIEAMGMAHCGLRTGVMTDISKAGCAHWAPVSVCREDNDLLAIDAVGKLFFGVRPNDNDMCSPEKRPTALLPAVVKR